MAGTVDYYAVLGVAPTSDDVVIRAAYRALMLKYHPDTNADARSTTKASQINEAYKVLSDASKRAQYDRQRTDTPRPSADAEAPGESPRIRKPMLRMSAWGWVMLGMTAFGAISLLGGQSSQSPAPERSSQAAIPPSIAPSIGSVSLTSPSITSASATGNEVPPDLQNPKTIAFDDMESAALHFDRVLQRSGIAGAKAYSEGCHRLFMRHPNWTTADRCAAFDFAAAHIDSGINSASKGFIHQNDYFIFEDENQADNYALFKATPELLGDRLTRIRRAAILAVEKVIDDRLDSLKARHTAELQNAVVKDDPAP